MTVPVRRHATRRLVTTMVISIGALAGTSAIPSVASAVGYQGIPRFMTADPGTSQARTVTVGDAAEAWFIASPIDLCSTPIGGCLPGKPLLLSPFPADTLYVGVLLGQETFRAYIRPDLAKLPAGSDRLSGTMTLPLAGAATDGTVMPESAAIKACLVLKPFADGIQGSTASPPPTDCTTSSKLRYHAGEGAFTVDLTPFLAAWSEGKPEQGIALVPDSPAPTDIWQVALNGRKRLGVKHVSSAFRVSIAVATPTSSPSATATPDETPPMVEVPAPQLPAAAGLPPAGPPPVLAPSPVARVTAGYSGFQYPAAFLIPLGLLGLAMFLIRLFTRDLTPHRR